MRTLVHQRAIVTWNLLLSICGICTLCASGLAQTTPDSPVPSDAEIRAILADRVDHQRESLGIVVGIIDPKGRRVITYGSADNGNGPLDGNTIFEIGGITKVFTALLLADMVQHGEVALTDPVVKYLPKTVMLPQRSQRITLQDLATHTSGLPRTPKDLFFKDSSNPFADYTVPMLYKFLAGYPLRADPGTEWEYSNVGFGLLGQVLALRGGTSYEALVHSRIAMPLGLNHTGITLSPDMRAKLAVGHDRFLMPVANWDFKALAGAGALRSSANDLLAFLAAELGYSKSPLAPAMAAMLKVRRPTPSKSLEIALGWHVSTFDEIVQKDGSTFTGGYNTFIAYHPKTRAGVVVLSNALTPTGVSDIGVHLLNPLAPLRGKQQKEVTVDPKLFDRYVGDYQLSDTVSITITREGSQLFAQNTGQRKLEIYPESDHNFFYKLYDAQLAFETDDQGRAKAVVLYYQGIPSRAKRIEKP
jgi:D-alanyl-D-alanine-carboxypeptidase/D-alanyl-D-alanine-endopeptidase